MTIDFELLKQFKIEDRLVGQDQPVFIIAEIGVNHNGSLELAKQMIDAAVACGADSVKFQTFRAEEFMADKEMEYEYESAGKKVKEKMFDMFKRLELSSADYEELFNYARSKRIIPLTSVADPESADLIKKIGVGALKLASEDLINLPLVDYVSRLGIPLILSTGMADEEEVLDAFALLKKNQAKEALFLHCVSLYPTPDEEVNLDRMLAIGELLRSPVGYSDHTLGNEACLSAVALGACMLEKHFTLDRNLEGPDHALSSDPHELKALVDQIRSAVPLKPASRFRGPKRIIPSRSEFQSRRTFRRSIVATRKLSKGRILERKDLALKRPGMGLRAREMKYILGKKLLRDIDTDERISWLDIEAVEAFHFRKATMADCERVYGWISDEEVRKAAFSQETIRFETHQKWFEGKLKDSGTLYWIAEREERPVGQIRFENIDQNIPEISVVIDPCQRGRGLGSYLLKLACEKFMAQSPHSEGILAKVRLENINSLKAFKLAGFHFKREAEEKGISCHELVWYPSESL